MTFKEYRKKVKGERGASMVEAMMVLPILFSTVTFIVWYSGNMHESNMMSEALYRAGKTASTIPNLDLTLVSEDTNDPQAIKEFKRAWKANDLSKESGINFLTAVGFFKGTDDKKLLPLTKNLQRVTSDGTPHPGLASKRTVVGEVMPLLPGECAEYQRDPADASTKKLTCNNKSINPAFADDQPLSAQTTDQLQPPKILLKNYPIKMVAVADRKGSIFHGGAGVSEFDFYVIREPIPAGPFSQAIESELSNGDVGDGIPPEPLRFAVGGDEVPVAVACAPALLIAKTLAISTGCPIKNSSTQLATKAGPAYFEDGDCGRFICKSL